ncbi:Nitrilase/cyanide hydratase and apolipoprotein N-acyltransferase [Chlamydiales bacterium STE3]|nr:Nitrilase/cyanide hydratase and apolipoprotein N-acyltransferase [Chlamydiales bacterium STE3]
MIRVGAYQITPSKRKEERKIQLQNALARAVVERLDFLCLPEGFLTGYYAEEKLAKENSLEVGSDIFEEWLAEFKNYNTTVIVGFNEQKNNNIFDSAAVIEAGKLLGIQRKHHLYHKYFTAGSSFSVFKSKKITFGITICLDTNYFEPSRILSLQGAVILFAPMCNLVPLDHPYAVRPPYYSQFVARSFENRCWLVAADWVWTEDGKTICPGNSVIYDPDGKEMVRSKEMKEELLTVNIPKDRLFTNKGLRFKGSDVLVQKLQDFRKSYES